MNSQNPNRKFLIIFLTLLLGITVLLGFCATAEEEQTEEAAVSLTAEVSPEPIETAMEEEPSPVTISLDFTDVPLSQILTAIARLAGVNIVGGEDLAELVSIHLKDVPLEDALAIVLESTDYGYIKEKEFLRIVPKRELPLQTEVFELRFAFAGAVKEAISHLVSGKGRVKSFANISEEEYSHVLIVTDTPESLRAIKDLIGKLDKKVEQVMIEAKFVEITLDKDNELGIDWVIQSSLSGATTKTRFPLPMVGAKQLDRPDTLTQASAEMTMGTISFANFSATLHALDSDAKVDLISSPRIAAKNGEVAEIIVGSRIPIPRYERHRETGVMEVIGYQDEEVGVVLRVTPIINSDHSVTLRLNPEVSEITGYTGPNNERPIVSTRQVSTVFTVGDGQTAVMGGLMQRRVSNSLEKVPGLGSIPVLGHLFSYRDDAIDRTELLIFITPHIMDTPQELMEELPEDIYQEVELLDFDFDFDFDFEE